MKTAIQIFLKQTQRGTKRLAQQLVLLCAVVAATLLLSLTACGEKQPEHTHKWEPANCTRGELCWSCKETRGEALGHDWVDATCEKGKHCSRCGKSEGNPLFHTSDGNGSCAVCKQELNIYATLDAQSSGTRLTVYGGAVLQFPFYSENRNPRSGVFGKEYWIYDQMNTLVAHGVWDQRPCTQLQTDGSWIEQVYHITEYISLSPGTYQIEFDCYWQSDIDREGIYPGQQFRVPFSEVIHATNTLTVH